MPLATIIGLLMPIITHLIDKLMAKDTTTMSVEELADHNENIACANGMCDMAKKIKA